MSGPRPENFDRFGPAYHAELSRCLASYGGRDALYYSQLKAAWLTRLAGRFLGETGGLDFLDLGCGTGATLTALAPRFRRGVGMDLSTGMLRQAGPGPGNAALVRGDVSRLPFADGSFDLVFSVTLLHHLEDGALAAVMAEAKRVLRPGGLTVHFDHNPGNFLTRRVVAECVYDRGATLRPLGQIRGLVREAGLTVRAQGYLIFFPAFLKFLDPLEKFLTSVPLGGQYFLAATR
jgi:SAM-dependent methyltransferase